VVSKNNLEEKLTTFFEWLIAFLLLAIFTITVLLVILRYVFNSSIIGADELITFLFIYTTAIGAPVAIRRREHIKITFFIDKLPFRYRKIIDAIGLLLVAFINVIMFYFSLPWIEKVGSDESPVLRIPLGIVKASVPIGCTMAVFYSLYMGWLILTSVPNKGELEKV
jgi:TRAP-type C4-dicarboxylate transport system permease small subunit